MSESINNELVAACQAFLDAAPSNGRYCYFCMAAVYGDNDVDDHSPDCEIVKARTTLARASEVKQPASAEDADTPETLTEAIAALQRRANRAVHRAGLKGNEPHPLNVIDVGLFGLLMVAKVAAGTLGKGAPDADA